MWLMLVITLWGDFLTETRIKDIKALPALYSTEAACLNATMTLTKKLRYKMHNLTLDCIKVERTINE